jgi:hypothetical protein
MFCCYTAVDVQVPLIVSSAAAHPWRVPQQQQQQQQHPMQQQQHLTKPWTQTTHLQQQQQQQQSQLPRLLRPLQPMSHPLSCSRAGTRTAAALLLLLLLQRWMSMHSSSLRMHLATALCR